MNYVLNRFYFKENNQSTRTISKSDQEQTISKANNYNEYNYG